MKRTLFSFFVALAISPSLSAATNGPPGTYDLNRTAGIQCFEGSAAAREILARNGFVVADPYFKQIFEPYIKSPEVEKTSEKNPGGTSLPSFITTDSAWHTYHVLLEEGVKEMEAIQAKRLLDFSRLLLAAAREHGGSGERNATEVASFASIGLAFQDVRHRQLLAPEEKRVVEALRTGSTPVAVPIGFNLAPGQFRAQSFYTESPELGDYFAARQWYASVVFRLSNLQETKLAVALATLIENNAELLTLWKQLSDPFDEFLASAEDGTVRLYADATKSVLGTNAWDAANLENRGSEIQRRLETQLPVPRVNDQLLSPEQYAAFSRETRGFRLLPPRRLPCAICFHNTTDPKIPGRMYPSGLDFLAASPLLRSPAAVRAVQDQFGKNACEAILKAVCGPMPDSLHGEAMKLLATLQQPLPKQVAPVFRSDAWSDLQLWTQLGAWAEQRHTWALHTKLSVEYMGSINPPVGMVAPYPDFFAGLATLSRRSADAFERAGLAQHFEVKSVASELLENITLLHRLMNARNEKELPKNSDRLEQLAEFRSRYYQEHRAEWEHDQSGVGYKKLENDLEDLARRCSTNGTATAAETQMLQSYFECRLDVSLLLNDFAKVSDRLAELAKKSLNGTALTKDDAAWIRDYGVTLARFHFYYGNSYEVPRDDFPIVTRVFSNPFTGSDLYAGLARPQALYIIVPKGDSLQLYRGAVMTYREFVRPQDQPLDDESWRGQISTGGSSVPPPFTRSFYSQRSVTEWMQALGQVGFDTSFDQVEEILWHLGSQATKEEISELIQMMANAATGPNRYRVEEMIDTQPDGTIVTNRFDQYANCIPDIVTGLSDIFARLPWESHQREIFPLLSSPYAPIADEAARVLLQKPAELDQAALVSGVNSNLSRTRRLYCVLLASLPEQTESTGKMLLRMLASQDEGERWQAALAIGRANWRTSPPVDALVHCLNDSNQFVAAAAVHSLAQLGATNVAPVLMSKLGNCLESEAPSAEETKRQAKAIKEQIDSNSGRVTGIRILDPDFLSLFMHVPLARGQRRPAFRIGIPPEPGKSLEDVDSGLASSLIQSLGTLRYRPAEDALFKLLGTDHETAVVLALQKLAPDRLENQMLATALDKQTDPLRREEAMAYLCSLGATNQLRNLIPLLDDQTKIVYQRNRLHLEWRICDQAADTIAGLLGWRERFHSSASPAQREAFIAQVRTWASSPKEDNSQ